MSSDKRTHFRFRLGLGSGQAFAFCSCTKATSSRKTFILYIFKVLSGLRLLVASCCSANGLSTHVPAGHPVCSSTSFAQRTIVFATSKTPFEISCLIWGAAESLWTQHQQPSWNERTVLILEAAVQSLGFKPVLMLLGQMFWQGKKGER